LRRKTVLVTVLVALAHFGLWALVHAPAEAPEWRGGSIAGLSFSPFRAGQDPRRGDRPSIAEIARDLDLIPARTIRTYGVAGILGDIPALAEARGIGVVPGAWIGPDPASNRREVDALIAIARQNAAIGRVLIGNEAVLRGDIEAPALIAELARARRQLDIPLGTAEPWHVWLDNPALAAAVDFIGAQVLPYWEGVPVEAAVDYVFARLDQIRAAYPGKPIVLTETGWPSAGQTRGGAVASRVNQARFLRQFVAEAEKRDLEYFIVEAFDQPWKIALEGQPGGYWGIFDADRVAKFAWTGPLLERDSWPLWAVLAIVLGLVPTVLYAAARPGLTPPGAMLMAVLPQSMGAMLVWLLIPIAAGYPSWGALAAWSILGAATLVLFLGVLADAMEAADLIWTGPPRRLFNAGGPAGKLPKVSIHLAIRGEPPDMVRRTLRALAALDYPDFEVVVIDNNTGDESLWRPVETACRNLGPRFRFLHRGSLPGFKGGALNLALAQCAPDAKIIAVVDSDYEVDRGWLRALVPLFETPGVALVQAPQDYRDRRDNAFKSACYWEYAGFFRLGMVRRNDADAIIQHGTMTLIRRAALDDSGGWAQWCITEDAELGLRLAHRGWQSAYVAQGHGRGLTPDSLAAYKAQRFRWVYGAMQILKRRWRWLTLDPALTPAQRFHYIAGWLPWIADAAGLAFTLGALIWTAITIARPETGPPPAVFIGPALAAFVFRQWRLSRLYVHGVPCNRRERWGAALAGLALSHTVAKAVICGFVTRNRPFRRTPKQRAQPSLPHALTMALEESVMLALLCAAAAAFALTQAPFGPDAWLWVAVLVVMALPHGATLALALVSAKSSLAPPVPAFPPSERRRKRRP